MTERFCHCDRTPPNASTVRADQAKVLKTHTRKAASQEVRMSGSIRPDRVDNKMGDQYSFLFAAAALFGSGACGAQSHLNPDAE